MIQGDQYAIPMNLTINGSPIDLASISKVEFAIDTIIKTYPGDVTYNADDGQFYFTLTQAETFAFQAGSKKLFCQARIKFTDGSVIGTSKADFIVGDSISKVVL